MKTLFSNPLSKRLKGTIWNLAYISGLLFLLERVKARPDFKGLIFFYHSVHPGPGWDLLNLSIPPFLFQRQVQLIKKKGTILSLGEFLAPGRRGPGAFPRSPQMVITFDDGYRDVVDYAWPILRDLNIVPTLFVCTDTLIRQSPLLWDLLAQAVQEDPRKEILFRDPSGAVRTYSLRTDSDRRHCVGQLNQILFGTSRKELKRTLTELFPSLKETPSGGLKGLYLRPDQARTCLEEGIEIGGHTASHPCLPKIPKEEWEQEIRGSKQELESLLDREIPFFAYPAGEFNVEVRDYIQQSGYQAALCTGKRPVLSDDQDPYTIPRICPAGVISVGKFYALISGVKPEWFTS
jgi:peptidoglycan/xylan/chitin deacetylase (PgdA/CDA1 family)